MSEQLVEVKTIGEVERIVHASGLWDGTTAVEFSDDGETWREAWAPTPALVESMHAIEHPAFARVSVYRKDVRIPTTVTIRWDEQCPTGENIEWAEKWNRSPMRHFGRTARMVGFRQTFRDLLGDMVIEDEDRASAPAAPEPPAARDWAAEFAAAASVDDLLAIVAEARAARVFKPNAEGTALDRQWKKLRDEMSSDAWAPAPAPALSEDEAIRSEVFFPSAEAVETRPVIRNRADRRAAARKKGRR